MFIANIISFAYVTKHWIIFSIF